jgi:hypothetical protein
MAVGLLTGRDLSMLGEGFRRIYPLDHEPSFLDLLARIDEAERDLSQKAQ